MTVSPDCSDKLKRIAKSLRRPEHEKFSGRGPLAAYAANELVDIRPPHPPLRIQLPVDWTANPYSDVTWQLYFHALHWTNVFAYGCTEEPEAAARERWAATLQDIALSYLRFLMDRDVDLDDRAWDDHAAAYRCSHLSYFYAAILHERLTPEEDAFYLRAMARHLDVLRGFIESERWANSNHLLFHAEGIADACAVFGTRLPEAEAAMDLGVRAVQAFVGRAFAEDGTCLEHAGYYQAFLMRRVHDTIGFFARLGRPLEAEVLERIRRGAAFLWSTMPRWPILPNYGDTQYEKAVPLGLIAPFTTEDWATPELLQWRDQSVVVEPPRLASWTDNGYHVFRARPAPHPKALYSLFLERRFRGPHGHFDGGSFMTWYGGTPFLVDSGGPFKYRDPLRFSYFQSQLGHNTVVFDRKGAPLTSTVTRRGIAGDLAFVVSEARFHKGGDRWIRVFGHAGADTVFCIDIAWPATKIEPVAIFHVAPEASLQRDGPCWAIERDAARCVASFAGPDGAQAAEEVASPEPFMSRVTRHDLRFEEAGLITRVLALSRIGATVFSFAGERAERCRVEDMSVVLTLRTPTGARELVLEGALEDSSAA